MNEKYSCYITAALLARHGVRKVVISPGSRNAPLIMAFHRRTEIETYTVIDERSAAFTAMGMAQATGDPVAIVCTSGSALLNYAPAVAEACYQHLPLIVVSADRPRQWIDQDDSQTIRQPGALANFVKYSCDLPDFDDPEGEMSWYAQRCVNDAMAAALRQERGPVHINMQIAEPITSSAKPAVNVRCINELNPPARLDYSVVKELAHLIAPLKVMIVAGFMPPSHIMTKAMARLTSMSNVVVLAESLANIHCSNAFNCVDRILTLVPRNNTDFQPQLVITVGGALVSRQLKEYLRSVNPMHHWSVGEDDTSADVFKHLTTRIRVRPDKFLSMLADALSHEVLANGYADAWRSLLGEDRLRHELIVGKSSWSSLRAFALLWPSIPARTTVQLSNGTCVRYAQLFYNPTLRATYCNRGVSGIDGCTSTAIGASLAYDGMTLLITGDMSMAYDLNSLQLPASERMRIVVINNRGGGIFRFIRSTRNIPEREKYLCMPPEVDIAAVASLNGYAVFKAGCEDELRNILPDFFGSAQKSLLEISVDPDADADAITGYFKPVN